MTDDSVTLVSYVVESFVDVTDDSVTLVSSLSCGVDVSVVSPHTKQLVSIITLNKATIRLHAITALENNSQSIKFGSNNNFKS